MEKVVALLIVLIAAALAGWAGVGLVVVLYLAFLAGVARGAVLLVRELRAKGIKV